MKTGRPQNDEKSNKRRIMKKKRNAERIVYDEEFEKVPYRKDLALEYEGWIRELLRHDIQITTNYLENLFKTDHMQQAARDLNAELNNKSYTIDYYGTRIGYEVHPEKNLKEAASVLYQSVEDVKAGKGLPFGLNIRFGKTNVSSANAATAVKTTNNVLSADSKKVIGTEKKADQDLTNIQSMRKPDVPDGIEVYLHEKPLKDVSDTYSFDDKKNNGGMNFQDSLKRTSTGAAPDYYMLLRLVGLHSDSSRYDDNKSVEVE